MVETLASDADVLAQIKRFCKQHDIPPTTFGRMAIGDGNLVTNLEANRSLTLKTAGRVIAFMRDYRPTEQARDAA